MKITRLNISIVANAILLTTTSVLAWRIAHPEAHRVSNAISGERSQSAAVKDAAIVNNVALGLKSTYAKLTSCGFDDAHAKQLVTALLPAQEDAAYPYWRASVMKQLSERVTEYDDRQAKRAMLIAAFGPAAARDPPFAAVFQPFGQRWEYLSGEQRLALEDVLSQEQKARLTIVERTGASVTASRSAGLQVKIQEAIGADGAREYNLRESTLSQSLGNTGFNFTENEFRGVYAALKESESVESGSAPMIMGAPGGPALEKIKEALGAERYEDYRKSQDPEYKALVATASPYGVSAANLDLAYRLTTDTRVQIARIQSKSPVVNAQSRTAIKALQDSRDSKLRELLGPNAFERFTASTVWFNRSFNPSAMIVPMSQRADHN